MILNINEVKNIKELKQELQKIEEVPADYQVAVIVYAFDEDEKIIFQRRGLGCRDERLKLETIGGRVKDTDIDFRTALKREIVEEVGNEADIEINEFIVATYAKTFDNRAGKEQNWIYLVYKGTLKSGNLQIAEPDKCICYERYKIGEVDEKRAKHWCKRIIWYCV